MAEPLIWFGVGVFAVAALALVAALAWLWSIKREQRRVFGEWDRARGVPEGVNRG